MNLISLWLVVVATPIHSFAHLSFAIRRQRADAHSSPVVLSFATTTTTTTTTTTSATDKKSSQAFNFGPVSERDEWLYTCERAGNKALQQRGHVGHHALRSEMQAWKSYVIDQEGVTHVLVLLDDNELQEYYNNKPTENHPEEAAPNLLEFLHQQTVLVQPMREPGAAARIWEFVDKAIAEEGCPTKLVAHCTGGVGRAGRVAAGWLVHQYGLTPEEATAETLRVAKQHGVNRKGDVAMLREWLKP